MDKKHPFAPTLGQITNFQKLVYYAAIEIHNEMQPEPED